MSAQHALKLLFELRAVLDRLVQSDVTLAETLAQDVDRAIRLTDASIEQLTEETPESDESEEEEEE